MKIITFLSDFGAKDWFVAAVKGEILKINKNAFIVDITHASVPHDIRSAAFILKSVYKNFPTGTVHLAVVDPGVGSERKPIIVKSSGYFFVGPDNGIFSYIYNEDAQVYAIAVKESTSSTFHARDIFGPVAAKLSTDVDPEHLGTKIRDYTTFEFPRSRKKGVKIYGEIIYIDHFGNCITNILNTIDIRELFLSKKRIKVKKFYGEGCPDEIICVKGSSGYYEIACNKGSTCDFLGAT
ncbi:unnamed protein product, partial [marine sediment metagenome]